MLIWEQLSPPRGSDPHEFIMAVYRLINVIINSLGFYGNKSEPTHCCYSLFGRFTHLQVRFGTLNIHIAVSSRIKQRYVQYTIILDILLKCMLLFFMNAGLKINGCMKSLRRIQNTNVIRKATFPAFN
jgi:hypothetical protein